MLRATSAALMPPWASTFCRPLVSLSGGLDSSIVAACLAQAESDAACLTLYTDDPAGDERGYAAALCAQLGFPLAEHRYDMAGVDLSRALGAHLPRPMGRAEAQPYEAAHREVAARMSADAFFSGNGGDNVFGFSQSDVALARAGKRRGMDHRLDQQRVRAAHIGTSARLARAAIAVLRPPALRRRSGYAPRTSRGPTRGSVRGTPPAWRRSR